MRARVEATVCDLGDGNVAVASITWKRDGSSISNDLCERDLALLITNGHLPKRGGRRPRSGHPTAAQAAAKRPYKRRKTTARRKKRVTAAK